MAYEWQKRAQQREEAYKLALEINAEKQTQEYNNNIKSYTMLEEYDTTLPARRYDNANIVKIIWGVKKKETLAHNVIQHILDRWPEKRESILELLEENISECQSTPPQDIFNLVEVKNVSFSNVIDNSVFYLPVTANLKK